MNCPQHLPNPSPSPHTAPLVCRHVLLVNRAPLHLLRHLDGWSKSQPQLTQFSANASQLQQLATDSIDWAVMAAPTADQLEHCVHELTRVARQGLLIRR